MKAPGTVPVLRTVLLAVIMALSSLAVRAASVKGPQLLERLPGDAWIRPAPRLELGHARPWPLPGLRLSWLRASLALPSSSSVELGLSHLDAGAADETVISVRLRWGGEGAALGAGIAREEIVIAEIERDSHLRWSSDLQLMAGAFTMGARWEGPWGSPDLVAPARAQILLNLSQPRWALAVSRRSAVYGGPARYELGFVTRPTPILDLGVVMQERAARFTLGFGQGSVSYDLAVILSGPRSGGLAFAWRWDR